MLAQYYIQTIVSLKCFIINMTVKSRDPNFTKQHVGMILVSSRSCYRTEKEGRLECTLFLLYKHIISQETRDTDHF